MSNPRFTPRRYTSEPENFGRTDWIDWVDDNDQPGKSRSSYEKDRIAAAKLQHRFSVAIRKKASDKFGSLKAYARECEVPYDRLSKVMRGEAIMRLEDVAQAQRILGEIVAVNPTSPSNRRAEQVRDIIRRQES